MNKYADRKPQRGDLVEYIGSKGSQEPAENDYGVVVELILEFDRILGYWWVEKRRIRAELHTVLVLAEEFHTLFALAHPDIYECLLQHSPCRKGDE